MKVGDLVKTTDRVKWSDIGIIVDIFDRVETVPRYRVQWTCGKEQWNPPSCIEVIDASR